MTFEHAVEIILFIEKETLTNDPNDPGGQTKWGISKRAFPNEDIPNLTKARAIALYKEFYWDLFKVESLPQCLRLLVFDCAVNQGGDVAIGLLQAAIGAKVDGNLGPNTLKRLKEMDLVLVLKKFVYFRWRRYAGTRGFPRYGEGWGARLLDVSLESVIREAFVGTRILP